MRYSLYDRQTDRWIKQRKKERKLKPQLNQDGQDERERDAYKGQGDVVTVTEIDRETDREIVIEYMSKRSSNRE